MPNVTGYVSAERFLGWPYSTPNEFHGSFTQGTSSANKDYPQGTGMEFSQYQALNFDANRANSIYENNAHVTPSSLCFNCVIKY